jgi:hypothetical protein
LQEIFLSKLTQLAEENNVLDAAAFKIGDFLWKETCASST